MDSKAAEEYHTFLHVNLRKSNNSATNLVWIPTLAISGYFALNGVAGAIFGGLIGYAICGLLARIDIIKTTIFNVELIRHLHEHTNEAEAGKRLADIEIAANNVAKKWWQRR